ncbi:MAG: M16 family metallopeptidase, partial [Acidimicrobiales bacterium]
SLTVPSGNPEAVATGFGVLAQWARAATLLGDDVVAERGVVLEEWRIRDEGPDGAVTSALFDLVLAGTPYAGRAPIATADAITGMEPELLRRFYEQWYRPDLMAVVVVGDLGVGEMQDLVASTFGELAGPAEASPRDEVTLALLDEPAARSVTHPDLGEVFGEVLLTLPDWERGTVGGERMALLDRLALTMLGNRLSDGASDGTLDLLAAHGEVVTLNRERTVGTLGWTAEAAGMRAATSEVVRELERARRHGFTATEFQRAAGALEAELEAGMPDRSDSRFSDEYAAEYVAAFLDGADLSSDRARRERVLTTTKTITRTEVNEYLAWLLDAVAPRVLVAGPAADAGALPTEDEILAYVAEAASARLENPLADEVAATALMREPDLVNEVDSGVSTSLRADDAVFANGVRVFTLDAGDIGYVALHAFADGGWSLLTPDEAPLARLATEAVDASGRGGVDRSVIDVVLADRIVELESWIGETREGFTGFAVPGDVEELFQLLHLAVTRPQVDEAAFRRVVDAERTTVANIANLPREAALVAADLARYGDDPRYATHPGLDRLDELEPRDLLDIYRARLGAVDDLVVVLVGEVNEREIGRLARRYLGTLPSRAEPDDHAVRRDIPGAVSTAVAAGTGEVGGVLVEYTVAFDQSTRAKVLVDVIERIVDERLLATVREALGAAYSPRADIRLSHRPHEVAITTIDLSTDPVRVSEVADAVESILGELATAGPTSSELAAAVNALSDEYSLVSFGDAFDVIERFVELPSGDDYDIDDRGAELRALSAADVRAAAQIMFDPAHRIEVRTVPR